MQRRHQASCTGGAKLVIATLVVVAFVLVLLAPSSTSSLVPALNFRGSGGTTVQDKLLIQCASKPWQICCSIARARRAERLIGHALTADDMDFVRTWEEDQGVLSAEQAEEKIKEAAFPISPEDIILRAKLYLAKNQWGVVDPSMLADDFVFTGPIVGPFDKEEFMQQYGQFDLRGGFPDMQVRWYDFRVDPYEPSRVWFRSRTIATNSGAMPPLITEATNKPLQSPPEAHSLKFNEKGQVVEYTSSYCIDRRQGNTGGLGGIVGLAYAVGKPMPIPEGQPYEPSWQFKFLNWLGKLSK